MFGRLDKDMVAKVADFGFSRELVTDYYKLKRRTLLPIKWLSPEALYDKSFTTKSDVVSNGSLEMRDCVYSLSMLVVIWSDLLGDIFTGIAALPYSRAARYG